MSRIGLPVKFSTPSHHYMFKHLNGHICISLTWSSP